MKYDLGRVRGSKKEIFLMDAQQSENMPDPEDIPPRLSESSS